MGAVEFHNGWPRERVSRGMRYYLMSIGLIVPLIMALMMFDNLDDRECWQKLVPDRRYVFKSGV